MEPTTNQAGTEANIRQDVDVNNVESEKKESTIKDLDTALKHITDLRNENAKTRIEKNNLKTEFETLSTKVKSIEEKEEKERTEKLQKDGKLEELLKEYETKTKDISAKLESESEKRKHFEKFYIATKEKYLSQITDETIKEKLKNQDLEIIELFVENSKKTLNSVGISGSNVINDNISNLDNLSIDEFNKLANKLNSKDLHKFIKNKKE